MKKSLFTSGLTILSVFMSFNLAAQDIAGIWYNTEKSGKIKIFNEEGVYFGEIIWLEEPLNENGEPKVNENSPNVADHDDPIIGLRVLKDFTSEGDGKFSGGTIYDPENGKTYKCVITFIDDNNLDVRGYVGIPALGRTEKWTRASK